jgi:hypothetical protein
MNALNSKKLQSQVPELPEFAERHFVLSELAAYWHMSIRTLRNWFENEPGVIRYGTDKLSKGRKRAYVSIRIPESVARRVYSRMMTKIHAAK